MIFFANTSDAEIEGLVHSEIKIMTLITHPHAGPFLANLMP